VKEDDISTVDRGYNKQALFTIENKPHFIAFEPALLLRAGLKNVKFQGSLSFSNAQSNPRSEINDLMEDCTLSFGISVNLKTKKK
jgi:hypothetical protein